VIGDHPVGLDLEVAGFPAPRTSQKQLERPVGHLEVVALVLEALQLVEDPAHHLAVEVETELGARLTAFVAGTPFGDDRTLVLLRRG